METHFVRLVAGRLPELEVWSGGRVVRRSSAKAHTAVRIRPGPRGVEEYCENGNRARCNSKQNASFVNDWSHELIHLAITVKLVA